MADWNTHQLGELVTAAGGLVKTGPFGSQLHAHEYTDDPDGIPVVMPRDMANGRIARDSVSRVSQKTAQRLDVHRLSMGDLVLARRGDIGRVVSVASDEAGWICGTGSMRIHIADHSVLDPHFLHYAMNAPTVRKWLITHAVGATMPNLNAKIVTTLPLSVPSVTVQRYIATFLYTFDELIRLNERRIELLESLARSLYREWFVRFRFPGYQEEDTVDSAQGSIPRSWAIGALGDIADLCYGKSLPARARRSGDVAVVSSAGIIDSHDRALVKGPGIVIGRKGNVGSVWWIEGSFFPIDTTYYVVSSYPLSVLYWQLRDIEFTNSHAAVPGLNREQAAAASIIIPPKDLAERFDTVNHLFFRRIEECRAAADRLSYTRDLLLPRLVTGQLDISDIDLGILASVESE